MKISAITEGILPTPDQVQEGEHMSKLRGKPVPTVIKP